MFKVYHYAFKMNQVFVSVPKSSTISELQLELPSAPRPQLHNFTWVQSVFKEEKKFNIFRKNAKTVTLSYYFNFAHVST